MECRARSGLARIDPLVSNGSIAEHVHAIHGSSGFSTSAGMDALQAGDCTSCAVTQDKSAYWTPALYFVNEATGKYTLVNQVGGMLAYYLLYPNVGNTSVSAFPDNFNMIAGDTNQRNFTYPVPDLPKSSWTGEYATQAFLRQAAIGFNCLNYDINPPEGTLYRHFLPDKAYLDANCKDGVRFELMFPSCWNGVDATSHDKKSHVAYPSQVMTGDCPEGFPERLPSLLYETIWDTNAFKGQAGHFMIANGDPTGYGYHGDFMTGWDRQFLQKATETCTNLSGKMEDCALFTIQSAAAYSSCNITLPPTLESENVVSGFTQLPGNPAIAYGPGYAAGAEAGSPEYISGTTLGNTGAAPVATLSYSAGTSVVSGSYEPGGIFMAVPTTTATSAISAEAVAAAAVPAQDTTSTTQVSSTTTSFITTTPAPSTVAKVDTQSYYKTAYQTDANGNVVEMLWVEEMETVTELVTSTVIVPAARHRKRGHMHQHGARRIHA
jgi:hypothetical protein